MISTRCSHESTRDEFAVVGGVDFDFSFAFQPIVAASTREVIAFEALVRGPGGELSADVFAKVPRKKLYRFDQACRLKALYLARRLNIQTKLNVNLLPNAIYSTSLNVQATLKASGEYDFPVEDIVFEVSESEKFMDYARILNVLKSYQDYGFQTAVDDFGTGYSGLKLLAEYQPNYLKIDRNLIADIHVNHVKQTIIHGIAQICGELSIEMVAEGVEKVEEYSWLREAGINIFQGYYFARPTFEALVEVHQGLF